MNSLTVAGLRNKYKFPSSSPVDWLDFIKDLWKMVLQPLCSYCVGGALVIEQQRRRGTLVRRCSAHGFPTVRVLASALMFQNSRLPRQEAATFAEAIIWYNDHGRFAQAWQVMEEAFKWEPQPEPV